VNAKIKQQSKEKGIRQVEEWKIQLTWKRFISTDG
jgi:hypothetical protein